MNSVVDEAQQSSQASDVSNAEWQQRKTKQLPEAKAMHSNFTFRMQKTPELWDVEGNRYIDFSSGIAVGNTGHVHPHITKKVTEQINNFSHTCLMVTPYGVAVELAEHLNRLAPGDTEKKSIFVTTGAEAVENAIKIARAHTGRRGIVAFHGGFHGRTNLTMGLTGKVNPYKAGFGPFSPDIYHIPYPNAYHGISEEDSFNALKHVFKCDISADEVAAIILEPVQGEGGFYQAPASFMQTLRQWCDKHGIVLICDEVQSGFARTGAYFATEHVGIEPDLITMAKGLGGGYPIAAVVGKADIMDAPNPGGLGGTYAGPPVGCAAALAVIEVIEEENLCQRSVEIGETVTARLAQIKQKHPQVIGEIRNVGAMIAVEFVQNGDVDQPNKDLPKAIVKKASEKGLILLSCGIRSNVIRILSPLTIQDDVLNEGMDIMEACIDELV